MGAKSSQPQTFVLRKNDSLNIPITFDPQLIDQLRGQTKPNVSDYMDLEHREHTLALQKEKKLIWESRSVIQANNELDELNRRMPKWDSEY